jgi:hypothetical protein
MTRLSVRVMMQTAFEAEGSEFLGWERYARGERDQPGLRNGYAELTIAPRVESPRT